MPRAFYALAILCLSLAPGVGAQPRSHAIDLGPVDSTKRLSHVTLALKRTPDQTDALQRLLAEQQDPSSPNYRKWLTPEEFGERFGASADDLNRIADWLRSEGFTIQSTARGRGWIVFAGTAGQIARSFRSPLHRYASSGKIHFAPSAAPVIPAESQDRIGAIRGLDDFYPEPSKRARPLTNLNDGTHALSPGDIAAIYSFDDRFFGFPAAGWNIAVVGNSAVDLADIQHFRTTFLLPDNVPQTVLVGDDPGTDANGLFEADSDLEWAGAVARNAGLIYVYAANVFDAAQHAIDQNLAQVLSMSYGLCEADVTAAGAQAARDLAQQANAQGITWVAASGDAGAAACDTGSYPASNGLAVWFPASMPEVTAIGGTEFQEGLGAFWQNNRGDLSSAAQYIPETAWNDSSAANGLMASGGGRSRLFSKPAWQTGPGVPDDGARDVPDLAFSASLLHDPYIVYSGGKLYAAGGTSLSAPIFAGALALTGQGIAAAGGGSAGFGNVNPSLYTWAADPFFYHLVFHDITTGNNIVPCGDGTPDCATGSLGYAAGPGYDLVTGLGSLATFTFLNSFRLATETTVSVTPGQGIEGTPFVLTATVRELTGKVPDGSVQFYDGAQPVPVPPATLNAAGIATAKFALGGGPHSITARYAGALRYRFSTSVPVSVSVVPAAPLPPLLLTPSNGAAKLDVSTTLSWLPSQTYATYDVYFGTASSPPFWGNVTGTRATPSGLIPLTTYYWRVAATNVTGTASSPVWSFTTSGNPVFTLSRIAGGAKEGFAGDGGPATQALLSSPADLIFDPSGNLYVADSGNHRVRKIGLDGTISAIAGNGSNTFSGDGGPAVDAGLPGPTGLALDSQGNLYVSDQYQNCVRLVSPDGNIVTFAGQCGQLKAGAAGDGGPATQALLGQPVGLAVDAQDRLYIANQTCVRRVEDGIISTFAGRCGVNAGPSGDGGPPTGAVMNYLAGITFDPAGNLYIADGADISIRKVADGVITTVVNTNASWLAIGPSGMIYLTDSSARVRLLDGSASPVVMAGGGASDPVDGLAGTSASFITLGGIRLGPDGKIYFAERRGIFALPPVGGAVLPAISGNTAWNTASAAPGKVAPGSMATLFGAFGLNAPAQSSGVPLPRTLSGFALQFQGNSGLTAPLFYVSTGQVNLQIPWELAGQAAQVNGVLNGHPGPAATISLAPFAPGIFTANGQGTGQGIIVDSGYRLVDTSNPSAAGNVIQIYCTGLGAVANPPATGAPASTSALSPTLGTPSATIGGISARILFSGLTPGAVGQYQINAEIPDGVTAGPAVTVVISIGGETSNAATIAVR
jgi:uncharacterized protein (TIGR03437 family)